jgi:hypothetical protein
LKYKHDRPVDSLIKLKSPGCFLQSPARAEAFAAGRFGSLWKTLLLSLRGAVG